MSARGVLVVAVLVAVFAPDRGAFGQQRPVIWSGGTGLRWESFDDDGASWSDWLFASAWVQRRSVNGTVRLDLGRHRRFGVWEEQAALDVYRVLWEGAYVNVRAAVAPDAETIAEFDGYVELFQNLPAGWEIAAGYNQLVIGGPDSDVQIAGVALARYVGDWYLRQRVQFVRRSRGSATGFAVNGYARYYVASSSFVEVGGGVGRSFQYVARGPDVEIDGRADIYARVEMFPWSSVGLAAETGYHTFDTIPDRLGLSLGLLIRR